MIKKSDKYNKCDVCKNISRTRSLRRFKNGFFCYKCFSKRVNIISTGRPQSLDFAQQKVRKVNTYYHSQEKDYKYCQITLPICFEGKKVRVIVVGDEE